MNVLPDGEDRPALSLFGQPGSQGIMRLLLLLLGAQVE